MKTRLLIIILINFSILLAFNSCKDSEAFPATKDADESELKTLLNNIQKMSEHISCDDPADWRIVPIGSKPCGGATDFIVYAAKIDKILFLQLVEQYNQKQKAYHVKWSSPSDCAIVMAPKSIECVSGKPKLIY